MFITKDRTQSDGLTETKVTRYQKARLTLIKFNIQIGYNIKYVAKYKISTDRNNSFSCNNKSDSIVDDHRQSSSLKIEFS